MPTKILVSGGTGFLGAYIIKELVEKGYAVRAIHHNKKNPFFIPAEIFNSVEWIESDILDVISLNEAMHDLDTVIHAAGKISFLSSEKKEMFGINVEGTANIVNAALENNIRRFVHISSVAAIGRSNNGDLVNEDRKWQLNRTSTHYAISKHHAEMEVWRASAEGLNAVIVNPGTILGFGDWNTSSCRLYKNIYNEFPWYTTGVNAFVDVEDVARATVALMESDFRDERFILNAGNWSFQQVFNTIADYFHKKRPFMLATPLIGEFAWRVEKIKSLINGKKPMLTKENAKVAQSITYFDNSKILKVLPGFLFNSLEKTLENSCEKYLKTIKTMKP